MTKIVVSDLSSGYGDKLVLNGISVDIPDNRITTIIGPNGCGKSTLLKSIANLIPPSAGMITINGQDVQAFRRKQLATILSILPQSPSAPEGVRVADLVARGRHPHQTWLAQWSHHDEQEVADALALTGVTELANRTVQSLSGGQRQRVWIAMTLAQQTEILFLDEPTTFLDLSAATDILNLVASLKKTSQRTIVLVLHDLNLAFRYSDHLIVMKDGTVTATGAPKEIVTPKLLRSTFDLEAVVIDDPVTGDPLIIPAAPVF